MKLSRVRSRYTLLVLVQVAFLSACSNYHDPGGGSHRMADVATGPTLSGQYLFATVSEMVELLEADPDTDWSTVDLERLRQHLIDMHRVTVEASVDATDIEGGARFVVRGSDERTRSSVRRMVSAHAETMAGNRTASRVVNLAAAPWQYESAAVQQGMSLTVTASDEQGVARIRGLGFIGVMVHGNHHPFHHQALATGQDPHHQRH